jgi:hypothetical protein
MQEICQSGSEGGAKLTFVPTPISAQGGGFAKPWVPVTKKREALKEGKILCKRRAIEQSRPTKMTITCGVAYFLPSLQGGPRLKSDTQGSAKPPPRPRQAYVADHTIRVYPQKPVGRAVVCEGGLG